MGVSKIQEELQPSQLVRFQSSHCSSSSNILLPQAVHVADNIVTGVVQVDLTDQEY